MNEAELGFECDAIYLEEQARKADADRRLQEALTIADQTQSGGIIKLLADEYRAKCEELDAVKADRDAGMRAYSDLLANAVIQQVKHIRLLEVAKEMAVILSRDTVWHDDEDFKCTCPACILLKQFEELQK